VRCWRKPEVRTLTCAFLLVGKTNWVLAPCPVAPEKEEEEKLLIVVALLAQGAQGDAPAVESGAALVWLPVLAGVSRLLPLACPLARLEHNGFGRVWLLWLVWVVVHLCESPFGLSWVEIKTASRVARLTARRWYVAESDARVHGFIRLLVFSPFVFVI